MREDCFAVREVKTRVMGCMETFRKCTALEKTLCEKGACPFYKPKEKWEEYMQKAHGTTDLDAVVRAYKETRGA